MAKPYPEHVSRFYSLALGRSQNFNARTDGLIAAADTTPDVSLYSLLYNLSTNTIAYFDNAAEGQIIHVINLPAEQLLFSGAQMKVSDSAGLWNAGDSVTFVCHNSSFYEVARSIKKPGGVTTIATIGDATPTVRNASVLIANSGGALAITDFDDAAEGQELTLINLGAGDVTLTNDVTKLVIGSNNLVITESQACRLVHYNGIWWLTGCNKIGGLLNA